jgi:hypothetical protein
MSQASHSGLSRAQIAQFIEDGYIKLDGAFDGALASKGRDQLWNAMGLSPDAPEAWTQPVVRLRFMTGAPFVDAANTPLLHAAYDALVGEGRWPKVLELFPCASRRQTIQETRVGMSMRVSAPTTRISCSGGSM